MPLLEADPPVEEEDDCENLKELLDENKQNIKPDLQWLANMYNSNEPVEHSCSYELKEIEVPVNENDTEWVENYSVDHNIGTATSVTITTGGSVYAALHLHPKSSGAAGGIFSWSDLQTLEDMYVRAQQFNKGKVTIMVVSPDPLDDSNYNVYAVTVNDIDTLTQKINSDKSKWSHISDEKEKIDIINEELAKDYRQNKNNLEKYFLERFGSYGISLFKLNSDEEWDELKLNATGTDIDEIPCE